MPRLSVLFLCLLAALVPCLSVNAYDSTNLTSPAIIINLPSRTLEFYSGANLVKEYPIAVGKPATPSPLGEYYILNKEVNPAWYPPESKIVVPSGPDNPLGYRWMGFLPTYGIHGTNAPWSIGLAVSNGCIRMQENDVEELFEMVPNGTPVKLTYDRVRVRQNSKGEVSIGLYPDVYGWQDITLETMKRQLATFQMQDWVTDDFLNQLALDEPDRQIVFAQLVNLKVNDKLIFERAVLQKDALYIPVWPVADQLKRKLVWDDAKSQVKSDKRSVPFLVKGDEVYVTAENAQHLFGGQREWNPEENTLEMNIVSAYVNARPLTQDVQMLDGVLAVPLLPLADAVGQKIEWDPVQKTAVLYGERLPIGLIDGQPYIQLTNVYDCFHAYVYWNEKGRSIDVTYPFKVEGGSD